MGGAVRRRQEVELVEPAAAADLAGQQDLAAEGPDVPELLARQLAVLVDVDDDRVHVVLGVDQGQRAVGRREGDLGEAVGGLQEDAADVVGDTVELELAEDGAQADGGADDERQDLVALRLGGGQLAGELTVVLAELAVGPVDALQAVDLLLREGEVVGQTVDLGFELGAAETCHGD